MIDADMIVSTLMDDEANNINDRRLVSLRRLT